MHWIKVFYSGKFTTQDTTHETIHYTIPLKVLTQFKWHRCLFAWTAWNAYQNCWYSKFYRLYKSQNKRQGWIHGTTLIMTIVTRALEIPYNMEDAGPLKKSSTLESKKYQKENGDSRSSTRIETILATWSNIFETSGQFWVGLEKCKSFGIFSNNQRFQCSATCL